jgi:prepilin-type N-terminal cleavage/methylation domain-containing protein
MPTSITTSRQQRTAFTLIEMTIVIAIIAILSAMAMSVYATAAQQARGMRTRAIIAKIDQLISEKYESYRTRQLPIRIPAGMSPQNAAQIRLFAIRELMRMEMPDHREDVMDPPQILNQYAANPFNPGSTVPFYMKLGQNQYNSVPYGAVPAVTKNYLRRASASWAAYPTDWSNDSAECLYLILSTMRDGDKSALDYFSPTEIGDLDGDGLNEIHDSWGRPIVWFRWAPGYLNTVVVTSQDGATPDPYDPFKADPRWTNGSPIQPYDLKPLILSTGPDKLFDVYAQINFHYSQTNALPGSPCSSDPFCLVPDSGGTPRLFGTPLDTDGDGSISSDNITNHDLEAR